ncbi:MarR family winged helix-turn-helix transcriptional regulator [Kitasatospora camelliae]|uniref:MarR family transcriptional regulator n=1 Tax=Kitasatospora camelliae TaxID=3156397 RepID=A0AAU8K3W3_9ACTN
MLNLTTYLLSRTGRAARGRLAQAAAERRLRLWHVLVMGALEDSGPYAKRELAELLEIGASDIAKTVDDLAAAGYVSCTRPAGDRRRVEADLTPAGRAALAEVRADLLAVEDELLAPLTPAERVQFTGMLTRLHPHIAGC